MHISGSIRAGTLLAILAATAAHAQGDASAGRQKFYTCAGCHAVAGYSNTYPAYRVPKLGGQNADYLVAALKEYRSGDRPHPTMHVQATALSDQDLEDIAAFLAGAPAKQR